MDEDEKPVEVCQHPHFHHEITAHYVSVKTFGVEKQLVFSLKLNCAECGRPYEFKAPDGFNTEAPSSTRPGLLIIPVNPPPKFERSDEDEEKDVWIH
jgi:hypothetical protein